MSGLALTGVLTDESGKRYKFSLEEIVAQQPPPPVEPPVVVDPPPPVEPHPAGDFVYKGLDTVWPKASTTGPRIPLTDDKRTTFSSAVTIVGKRFNSSVRVTVNGVKFVDCEFNSKGGWGIDADGKRVSAEYCRFKGGGGPAAVLGAMEKFHRCDVSGYDDGLKPQGSNLVITENAFHDPSSTASSHNDGIQAQGGSKSDNVLIQGNYIAWRDTSEVFVQAQFGALTNYVTRWNWLGGSDLPIRYENKHGHNCTGKIIENVVKRGHWGYIAIDNCSPEVRGNIDAVTGAAIAKP